MAAAGDGEPGLTDAAPVVPGCIVIVLPPREGFSPSTAGAVGLLVASLAAAADVVIGSGKEAAPFAGPRYVQALRPRLRRFSSLATYANGVARTLAALRPGAIEVHNRPSVALLLARHFPHIPVTLFLHNDPRSMRGARTPRARADVARRVRAVAVSHFLASLWGDNDGGGDRPLVLPNAIDLARIPPLAEPAARERLILFAGRVVADKGADLFVEACARALPLLPGWRAAMIGADRFFAGSPDTPFIAALRPAAIAAGIEMRGYQPHSQVLDAMANAAITVVPSRWEEPFGMVALEALACGTALITTRRGGLPEVVGDAAVTVAPDKAELADAILALARDDARVAALSDAGRARASRFGIEAARSRLAELRQAQMERTR